MVANPQRTGRWVPLAEAILRGSKLGPQCFGKMYIKEATCALGASEKGGYRGTIPLDDPCLVCGGRGPFNRGLSLIPHLNDDHRWTREAIADWLMTL